MTVLAHGDLDGVVSAILVLRGLTSADTNVRITNGEHLHRELRRLAGDASLPERLFILDIPLQPARRAQVAAAWRGLSERGVGVHLYDHHHGWNEAPEVAPLCTVCRVDTTGSTAAALVWRGLSRGDRRSHVWLRLLSEKGDSSDPDIVGRFGLLAALMQPQHHAHTEAVLKALARDDELSDEYRALAAWYYEVQVPREQAAASRAEVLTTRAGRRVGWLDLRQHDGYLLVAGQVVETLGTDLAAIVTRRAVILGGHSVNEGTDLTCLHGEHTVDGVRLAVVGHKSPVRMDPVSSREVTDESVEAARALVADRL